MCVFFFSFFFLFKQDWWLISHKAKWVLPDSMIWGKVLQGWMVFLKFNYTKFFIETPSLGRLSFKTSDSRPSLVCMHVCEIYISHHTQSQKCIHILKLSQKIIQATIANLGNAHKDSNYSKCMLLRFCHHVFSNWYLLWSRHCWQCDTMESQVAINISIGFFDFCENFPLSFLASWGFLISVVFQNSSCEHRVQYHQLQTYL